MKNSLTNFLKVADEKHDIYFHWPNQIYINYSSFSKTHSCHSTTQQVTNRNSIKNNVLLIVNLFILNRTMWMLTLLKSEIDIIAWNRKKFGVPSAFVSINGNPRILWIAIFSCRLAIQIFFGVPVPLFCLPFGTAYLIFRALDIFKT